MIGGWFAQILLPLIAARAVLRTYPGWCVGIGGGKINVLLRIRKRIWSRLERPCVVRWLDGMRLYVYPGNEISRAIFLTGYYEPNQFCLLDRILRPGMTFVDAGANMGLYTLFGAKRVGNEGVVVGIEPSSRDFERLKRNTDLNALKNVRLLEVALSNCQGEAELLVASEEKSGHNTLGSFGYESVVEEGRERVRVERLDDLLKQEGLHRIDVIKMDVEGAELFALQGTQGTLTRFKPVVLLELSDRTLRQQGCTSGRVWQFLTRNGYRIYAFDHDTGLPVPAHRKEYFDADNVVAVHEDWGGQQPW